LDVYEFCSDECKKELDPKRKLMLEAMEKNTEPKLDLTPLKNETGIYELQAVVTHKGLDADGGHYVAWVRLQAQVISTWVSLSSLVGFV